MFVESVIKSVHLIKLSGTKKQQTLAKVSCGPLSDSRNDDAEMRVPGIGEM